MPNWIKLFGAAAIVAASFFGTLWITDRMGLWPPGCPAGETVAFTGPFSKYGAVGYSFEAPTLNKFANAPGALTRSPFVICEDLTATLPADMTFRSGPHRRPGRFNHSGFILYLLGFRQHQSEYKWPQLSRGSDAIKSYRATIDGAGDDVCRACIS